MTKRRYVLCLTEAEYIELTCLAGQGWGDGGHEDWVRSAGGDVAALTRARKKLYKPLWSTEGRLRGLQKADRDCRRCIRADRLDSRDP